MDVFLNDRDMEGVFLLYKNESRWTSYWLVLSLPQPGGRVEVHSLEEAKDFLQYHFGNFRLFFQDSRGERFIFFKEGINTHRRFGEAVHINGKGTEFVLAPQAAGFFLTTNFKGLVFTLTRKGRIMPPHFSVRHEDDII